MSEHDTGQIPADPAPQSPSAIPSPPPTDTLQSAETGSTTPTPKRTGRGGPRINSGRPKGIHTPLRTKKLYNAEELAKDMATTLAKGHGLLRAPTLRHISFDDKERLARAIQEPVEAFNDRLATKLRSIADKLADSIEADVDNDRFKPGEKGFIFSVMHDKRLSLDGSRALANSSVNLTVNNFGVVPKHKLMEELDGLGNIPNITPSNGNIQDSTTSLRAV